MLHLILALSLVNFTILIGMIIYYFNKNYEILPKEVYNTLADLYEKHKEEEESKQELAGGTGVEVGFGADYLYDDDEEEE